MFDLFDPFEIDAGTLVFNSNEIVSDESSILFTSVDKTRLVRNVFSGPIGAEPGTKIDPIEIDAGGLLVVLDNNFFERDPDSGPSTVTFNGSRCRIRKNTFGANQTVINNCP